MYSIAPFTVIMLIFMFIYTILGMELYAREVRFLNNIPDKKNGISMDSNFDNFLEAFATVFVCLANNPWSTIYIDTFRSGKAVSSTIYFVSLLLIGQFILWNLFLAIMLQNFEDDSKENEIRDKEEKFKNQENVLYKAETYLKKLYQEFFKKQIRE